MAAQRGRTACFAQPDGRAVRALKVGQDVDAAPAAGPGQDQAAPMTAQRGLELELAASFAR